MQVKGKKVAKERREQLRKDFWPDEDFWTASKAKGWFSATRTLSLILGLMDSKPLSGTRAPSKVYVELLTRHFDSGIIEMKSEDEHAYAAGYTGNRAVRSWRERMQLLEELGFIKTKEAGGRSFHYVLLMHPTVAVKQLYGENKVSEDWWTTYRGRQAEVGEATFEARARALARAEEAARKVVKMDSRKTRDFEKRKNLW